MRINLKFWEVFFKGPHRRETIKILSNLLLSLLISEPKKKKKSFLGLK